MGRRGLHRETALAVAAGAALLAGVVAGCGGGTGKADLQPSPSPTAPSTATQTQTSTPVPPTPTATPDPVGPRPASAQDATTRLSALLQGAPGCPEAAVSRWGLACAEGDLDGDGAPDTAYLVPLDQPDRIGDPAMVLVCRTTAACALERLGGAGVADGRALGRSLFRAADVTGDGRAEVIFLETVCTATACRSEVAVQRWDGSAWRDLGPADGGLDNVQEVLLGTDGTRATLTVRTGELPESAGPTRALTVTYTFDGMHFTETARGAAETVFLVHAIQDADRLFAAGAYGEAAAAYRAAAASTTLRDWRAERNGPPARGERSGREQLQGYALFRAAVAEAAAGNDPTRALDAAIVQGKEPLFQNAAQAFRQGYQENGDVRGGCLSATRYLTTDPAPAYVSEIFDYGAANPRMAARDICPF